MKNIPSFTIDHLTLKKGVYLSRQDQLGDQALTTFDLRMTDPNDEPVMGTDAIHAIEHLGATFLRNSAQADQIIYFGPMGCRTGFYLLIKGDKKSEDILDLLVDMYQFICQYQGQVPGASPEACGNYSDINLDMAKFHSKIYLDLLEHITDDRLEYS